MRQRLGHERVRRSSGRTPSASISSRRWRRRTRRRSTTSRTPNGRRSTALEHAAEWDSGYSKEHSTRPQTVGYGLTDSPAALCAWIVEKLLAWSDGDVLTRDQLLDMVMLYWLPRTGASSARLYWESIRQVNEWISGTVTETVDVPTACSVFPGELQRPSRRWAERRFTDIRYWSEPPRGGHFAALEQPELFVR